MRVRVNGGQMGAQPTDVHVDRALADVGFEPPHMREERIAREYLPPILGQVGSTEILLDDTVRAAERAKEANVPFYLEIWRGMPHVFPIFSFLPESKVAMERIATFIQNSELGELPERYGRSEARQ